MGKSKEHYDYLKSLVEDYEKTFDLKEEKKDRSWLAVTPLFVLIILLALI